MIVEIIGPSGVGKSYLIKKVMVKLHKLGLCVDGVHESWDIISNVIPGWLKNPRKHNIYTDFRIAPWSIIFCYRYLNFTCFFIGSILKSPCSLYQKFCMLRGIWRKAGMVFFFRKKLFDSYFIFIDEGICHSIHNFLVLPDVPVDKRKIKIFAKLVPMPDILVVLTGKQDQLIRNLDKRGDWSPRIENRYNLLKFIENAIQAFDMMMRIPRVKQNMLNLQCSDINTVETIVEFITDKMNGNL